MQKIKQEMAGYKMPSYMEEILTENYCKSFMRMSIVRDSGNYSFSYKPESCRRLDMKHLRLYDKLILLRNLISISENSSEHLIDPESYLLEPELIYAKGGSLDQGSLRLMFYPDVKRLDFRYKLVLFADRIMDKNNKDEREMLDRIREASEPGDINRIKLFLEKNISRIEYRMNEDKSSRTLKS